MIKVNSQVRLNMPQIERLKRAQVAALEMTAEAVHSEVVQAQVVPRMDGNLQGESFFVDTSQSKRGKVRLIHDTPYARRLYYHPEYDFHKGPWEDDKGRKHDGNPNAKAYWFEDWEEGGEHDEFAINTYKEIYRRLAGL